MAVKLKELQKAAKELGDVLKLKPKIDIDQDEDDLKADILEAASLINEDDELSEETTDVISTLKKKKKASKEEEPEEPEEGEGEEPEEEEGEEPEDDDAGEGDIAETISCEVKKIVEKGISKGKDKDWMLERITEYFEDLDLEGEPCEEPEEKPKKPESKKKGGFARK